MATRGSGPRGIKDLFYETRVLLGRDSTLRRFAEEQVVAINTAAAGGNASLLAGEAD